MAKKKYRVYKAGGAQQGRVMNPTAQFLARAQEGMQQPSEEEMMMMQQQAMQQQQGQPQMQQQGGQDQMMQQLVAAIGEALQNGAQPEEVVAKLLQDQVEPQMVAEALVELGMPPEEVEQVITSVIQQLQGGQEQGQPSEEEMMAMQQQQMAEQAPPQEQPMEEAPMSKGGYVKRKLKMAQEGMQQNIPSKSNTNLAAEDGVNNVAPLLEFAKTNTLKNQYEQEYDQMQGNQDMMPEARLGREARQERRGIRQDERTERTEMRQAARTARQANRLANRAVRQVSSPFGRVPGFSPFSPSPFMGGSMRLEDVERGLFGRLKNFKMSIDGMGLPSRFSEGMFINGLYNPYGMPAGQESIIRRLRTPGEANPKSGTTGSQSNPNTSTQEGDREVDQSDIEDDGGNEETPKVIVDPKLAHSEDNSKEVKKNAPGEGGGGENLPADDFYGKTAFYMVGAVILYKIGKKGSAMWVKRKARRTKNGKVKVSGPEVPATTTEIKRVKNIQAQTAKGKSMGAKYNSPAATAVRNHPINRPRVQGRMQPYKAPKFKYPSVTNRSFSKYAKPKVKANWLRRTGRRIPLVGKYLTAPLLIGSYLYDNLQEGGYVDSMDQDYGNPDLYRFTGGGDYDNFDDGGYYEDGGYAQYEDVNDPYMPYMQDGGYIPRAFDGYTVEEDDVTGTDKDTFNEAYSSSADDRFENPTQELYQSLSPEQREMYKAEYQRRQKAGYGQRGYGQRGYGMQGYGRRGLFNSVMGINAPGAIQRRQYLQQMAGPTYADGTPVIGGALPEGYHLRTGSSKDGNAGIVYNTNNLRDRVFGRKDVAGNRVRVPKKTISYYFEGPNDTTPSLAGGDNAISNFKINPAPSVAEEESDAKGKSKRVKGRTVKGMTPTGDGKFIDRKGRLRTPDRVRGKRSSEEEVNQPQAEQEYYNNFDGRTPAGPQNEEYYESDNFYDFDRGVTAGPQNQDYSSRIPAMPITQPQQIPIRDQYPSNSRVNAVQGDYPGFIGNSKRNSIEYEEGGESRSSNREFAKEQLPLKNKISRKARRDLRRGLNRDEITRDEYLEGVEEKASQMGPFNYNYSEDIHGNLDDSLENETISEDPSYSTPDKLVDVTTEQLAENQRILDEQEAEAKAEVKAKAKAKAKAAAYKKKYSYDFNTAQKRFDQYESIHKFDNSHTKHDNFANFEMTPEMMDDLGVGVGRTSEEARVLREEYNNRKKKRYGEDNIVRPRQNLITNWAKSEYEKINNAWLTGNIDQEQKDYLEGRIRGRQYDELQRIEDNYYDAFKDQGFGVEKPTYYHNYSNAKLSDNPDSEHKGKGVFYKRPSKEKKASANYKTENDEEINEYGEYVQYGGYQEGEERYMNADEISQFMAAGGVVEFLD